ncbi:MAG: PQQ-dependent sugar dehydrogenase [Burkholderiales bacterium]|jgi:aldose sugar dehydrogenase|nr:PQQ-dependent sugar dehydrogenase [Burkholderiales bacterium]
MACRPPSPHPAPPTARSGARGLSLALLAAALLAPLPWHSPGRAAESEAEVVRSERGPVRVSTLTSGLDFPWSLAFLPDGRMLVTERPGRLRILGKDGALEPRPVDGLPKVAVVGQGGLLDVVLHPAFATNRWVYLSFASGDADGVGTEVVRGRLVEQPGRARLEDVQSLFRMAPRSTRGQHFGSRLAFDARGFLYITLGDRGEMQRAQRLDDHAGSVIRLHDDGRVPADNPFVRTPGAKPEKFTLGNRNIQGAAIHPVTGELWTHEHGPQGGDEVNVIRAGRNYGWPVITHGVNYGIGTRIGEGTARAGMEQPLARWTPSIAPSGMAFYTGTAFPAWKGNLLVGALRGQALHRLELDGEKVVHEERLLQGQARIRDVRVGPDGLVYLLTDERNGRLLRLDPPPR